MRALKSALSLTDMMSTMKALQAIQRSISNAWLAAAPLVVLFAFVIGVPVFFGAAHGIARLIDPDAADDLFMGLIMWMAMALLVLTPSGLAIYAMFRLARRLVGKKEP
jgi:ABC-type antimicrobial peptide transport system permease subunit